MKYSLYYSLRSPFGRRARLALHRLDIPFESLVINVFEPTEDLFKANPLALVPALGLGDGRFLPDSSTILEYLHENHGEKIWPSSLAERTEVRRLSAFAEGIMTMTVSYFLEGQRKTPEEESKLEYSEAIERTLKELDHSFESSKAYYGSGLALTQAGWDLMTALEYLQLRAPQLLKFDRLTGLKHFYERNFELPLLRQTQPPA